LITPPVQGADLRVRETVRDTSDRFPEERRVVRDVEGLFGERLHDVGFSDEEGLDDGAEGEELEGGLLGHLSFFHSFLLSFSFLELELDS